MKNSEQEVGSLYLLRASSSIETWPVARGIGVTPCSWSVSQATHCWHRYIILVEELHTGSTTYRVVRFTFVVGVLVDGSGPATDCTGNLGTRWLAVRETDHARVLPVVGSGTSLLASAELRDILPLAANGAAILVVAVAGHRAHLLDERSCSC